MNRGKTIATLLSVSLMLLIVFGLYVKNSGAGQIVSGWYSITETTELGTRVRVTLQIRFTNASERRLFITQMSLHNGLQPERISEERGSVILEPNLGTEVTRQFDLSKSEFEFLRQSMRPRLSLRMQAPDGAEITVTIALMRRPG